MALVFERCHLEQILLRRKMSKAEFASIIGVSRATVTKWCKGEQIMSLENAFNAAFILKCSVHDIYHYG